MFNSRIHFRTNTFDILSHLSDRETTDGRYIHVRLLTYFHNFSLQSLPETMGQIVKRLNTANVQFPPCPLFNVAAIKK